MWAIRHLITQVLRECIPGSFDSSRIRTIFENEASFDRYCARCIREESANRDATADVPVNPNAIAFSDPYLTIGLALLAGKNSGLTAAADLDRPGRTVAVRQGTTAQVWAKEHLKQAKVLVLDKESSAVLEVVQGKADGFLYDQMSVWKHHQEHPVETVALLRPVQAESWAVALRPDDTVGLTQVNAFLKSFRASGGFDRLGNTYLKNQKEAFAKAGIPFYF
jgi:polar amino acid transport system substrate-binding protein